MKFKSGDRVRVVKSLESYGYNGEYIVRRAFIAKDGINHIELVGLPKTMFQEKMLKFNCKLNRKKTE